MLNENGAISFGNLESISVALKKKRKKEKKILFYDQAHV